MFKAKTKNPLELNSDLYDHPALSGSPTMTAQKHLATPRPSSISTNHDGPHEQHGDSRLRNAPLTLVEKNRTMSSSGSFREVQEEGQTTAINLYNSFLRLIHYL